MLVYNEIIKIKYKITNEFIHVDAMRFTSMPLDFEKTSIKTSKTNEYFSHGHF